MSANTPNGNATGGSGVEGSGTNTGPYVPQLSASTQLILERMRASGSGIGDASGAASPVTAAGYEDARRSVLESMKTTMTMEINTPSSMRGRRGRGGRPPGVARGGGTPTSTSNRGKAAGRGRVVKAGTKRKKIKDESESAEESAALSGLGGDSDSDGSGSATNMPTQTKSGRQISRPAQFDPAASATPVRKRGPNKRIQEQALCKRCGRGHSPQSNMIVFCDGCNLGWHQMCHGPVITDEIVKDETQEWFCHDCQAKRSKATGFDTSKGTSLQSKSTEEVCCDAGFIKYGVLTATLETRISIEAISYTSCLLTRQCYNTTS